MLLLLLCVSGGSFAYEIDGQIEDWGVSLETDSQWVWSWDWSHWGWNEIVYLDQDSFIPDDPEGRIDYVVEDYYKSDNQPGRGEYYDYEALYFDNSASHLYVGVIASHPWTEGDSTLYVELDGVKYYASADPARSDFDAFACANMGVDEVFWGACLPQLLLGSRHIHGNRRSARRRLTRLRLRQLLL
jgi:hypothetical protein